MKLRRVISIMAIFILTTNLISVNATGDNPFTTFVEGIQDEVNLVGNESQNSKTEIDVLGKSQDEKILDSANSIHIKVEMYLKDAYQGKENLDEKTMAELAEALDDLDEKVNNSSINDSKAISTKSSTWYYGDILYYGIGNDNAAGEPSYTGHTAVLTDTSYYVVEAAKTSNNGAEVYHWNRTYLWSGCSGVKQYKVTSWLGTEASASEKDEAVEYGLDQVGDPYKLKTTIWNESSWYCSKLTFRQWSEAGYDLGSYFTNISNYVVIIPAAIRADANTRLRKTWGTSTPTKF